MDHHLTHDDLLTIKGVGNRRAQLILDALSEMTWGDDILEALAAVDGLNRTIARAVAKMLNVSDSPATEAATATVVEIERETPEVAKSVPEGTTEWEEFYALPHGVIDAILHQPAPGRIAQIVAHVRDETLREQGIDPFSTEGVYV